MSFALKKYDPDDFESVFRFEMAAVTGVIYRPLDWSMGVHENVGIIKLIQEFRSKHTANRNYYIIIQGGSAVVMLKGVL